MQKAQKAKTAKEATSNKCIASSNKCLTSSNKKPLETKKLQMQKAQKAKTTESSLSLTFSTFSFVPKCQDGHPQQQSTVEKASGQV